MDIFQTNTPTAEMTERQIKDDRIARIREAVGHSREILLSVTTVFPLTWFPDTVTVDREKVTIVNRTFFRVAEIVSTRIHDVLNVTADVGPYFGSVHIHTRFFDIDKHVIRFLRRDDALRLKRILQGYVIACQKGIDCESFTIDELTELLDDMGQGDPSKDM